VKNKKYKTFKYQSAHVRDIGYANLCSLLLSYLSKTAKKIMKHLQKTWTGSDATCFTECRSKLCI